jgi:hypothetical protein
MQNLLRLLRKMCSAFLIVKAVVLLAFAALLFYFATWLVLQFDEGYAIIAAIVAWYGMSHVLTAMGPFANKPSDTRVRQNPEPGPRRRIV